MFWFVLLFKWVHVAVIRISMYNHAVLVIHFSASLSYHLQILKCLFPSLMIYTLEQHSKYCDLMVFSCLQVLWRPVR